MTIIARGGCNNPLSVWVAPLSARPPPLRRPLTAPPPLPPLPPCPPSCPCREVTEQYLGKEFQAFKPMPAWHYNDYMGWGEQGDGKLFYGVFVQNGRCVCAPAG